MIKKLHAYIIKEFFKAFFFGIVLFSILMVLNLVFDLINFFLSKSIAVFLVLKLLAFYIINVLPLSIPMAVLFGVLLAYGRLTADNEITAMKSSGLSYYALSIPIIILILIMSFFLLFFNHFLAPEINSHFRSISEEIAIKRPLIKFNAKSVTDLNEYRLYANKVNNKNNTLLGVSIYKFENKDTKNIFKTNCKYKSRQNNTKNTFRQSEKATWRITASSGTVKICENGIQLTLHHGYLQKFLASNIKNMMHMTFKNYVFFIPFSKVIKKHDLIATEISSLTLLKTIKQYKKENLSVITYERAFWSRWIFAFAPFAFLLIALPIGIMAGKNGRGIGFVMSLIVILIYYALFVLAVNLSEKGYAPIGIIIWVPNFTIAVAGICLFIKIRKK
jgi:lipopolysaccharide export system permease protein